MTLLSHPAKFRIRLLKPKPLIKHHRSLQPPQVYASMPGEGSVTKTLLFPGLNWLLWHWVASSCLHTHLTALAGALSTKGHCSSTTHHSSPRSKLLDADLFGTTSKGQSRKRSAQKSLLGQQGEIWSHLSYVTGTLRCACTAPLSSEPACTTSVQPTWGEAEFNAHSTTVECMSSNWIFFLGKTVNEPSCNKLYCKWLMTLIFYKNLWKRRTAAQWKLEQ